MIRFTCDDEILTKAYEIALNDCLMNIKSFKSGLLAQEAPCIMAGAGYESPWTRDTAINVYNAFALLDRAVAKNTLYAVLNQEEERYYVDAGDQYWDAIIWAIGAERYYTVTGDTAFLKLAQNTLTNSLEKFEKEEFDAEDNLFRGAAVYGDGIAAYPDRYGAEIIGPGIMDWPKSYPDEVLNVGVGIPMKALSTNCIYYQAYTILARMNERLGLDSTEPRKKAEALKRAINKSFWNEKKGSYDYLAYECDHQEALGVAFALLFGVADERQAALVLKNADITEQGIACVWPSFERYLTLGGYGRHSGAIWPHAQGFWGSACATHGDIRGFETELYTLAKRAVRDGQFYEIYHPDSGEVYGGLQEDAYKHIRLWKSEPHQTWSATAYLSLIYYHILGADIGEGTVTFAPMLPTGINRVTVNDFQVGNTVFDIQIIRNGVGEASCTYDTAREGRVSICLAVS